MAVTAKAKPAATPEAKHRIKDEEEEGKHLLKTTPLLRQIREADNEVGRLRSNAACFKHRRRRKLPAHQQHPQALRAGRSHQAETEEGEGSEEEKASQGRQAPQPEEEDGDAVKRRRGEVRPTLDANKYCQMVGSHCR